MADTPEAVALELLRHIAYAEIRAIADGYSGSRPDRRWLLDTYAECLDAVKNLSPRPSNAFSRSTGRSSGDE
jgi:hypothetical protein